MMRSRLFGLAPGLLLVLASACGSTSTPPPAPAQPASADGGIVRVPDAAAGDTATDTSPESGTASWPLGATYDSAGQQFHFSVRSAHATRIELDLFDQPLGAAPKLTTPLTAEAGPPGLGDTWSVTVTLAQTTAAGIGPTVYYGYRAWGPNWPYVQGFMPGSTTGWVVDVDSNGNRYDPNKLLIDPYTREISHDPLTPTFDDPSVYAVGSNRATDSAPSASKGIVLTTSTFDVGTKPTRALADDIIYEVHVRGLTMNDPTVTSCGGTYAAAASKAPYLASLGVTAIELLPIEETQNDTNDLAPSSAGDNYWGYSTLADFAPDRRYACDQTPGGPTTEFAAMVKAMHAQGIKVFLDVVYNHTAEGGGGSLLSFRGLDNASYYELSTNGTGFYDDTGVGANFNVANPIAASTILDSLAYFSGTLGVDGFRFDLAAVLGNTCTQGCYSFSPTNPAGVLAQAVATLPGAVLIAEPWGVGDGTYELGQFPPGWSEWNGQFRDTTRIEQNEIGVIPQAPSTLANDLSGSPSLFSSARGPTASINYVVSHDGFTLNDLYACDAPQNAQPWPYGPSSGGTTTNYSWDQGGTTSLQLQAERTALAILSVSAGVPMITGGDEIGRTILCNNNPYNLDSIANWLDWPNADTTLQGFLAGIFAFRSTHVVLRPVSFRDGTDHNGNGLKDVTWLEASGAEADAPYMADTANAFLAFRLDGTEVNDVASSIYVAINASPTPITAALPAPLVAWFESVDTGTALATGSYIAAVGSEPAVTAGQYTLASRAVAVLVDR
jgi:isoamylase